jgi:hypothetical protein
MARERHIRVRGIQRKEPDLRKLGRALIELAQAQAEADAQAEHERPAAKSTRLRRSSGKERPA